MLELYHHGSSVCAAKVRLALTEKGLSWEGHYVDILAGEQFRSEFLKLNPEGLVPVLVHDGVVIRESTVINEYVEEVFDGPSLLPDKATGRAAVRLWTKLVDESLHPAVAPLTFAVSHRHLLLAMPPDELEAYLKATPNPIQRERKRAWVTQGLDAPEVRTAILKFARAFDQMEAALDMSAWLAGSQFSLADIAVTPYIVRIEMLGMWELWQPRYPKVGGWFQRVKARKSFGPALYDHLPASLRETMLSNGRKAAPQLQAILAECAEAA